MTDNKEREAHTEEVNAMNQYFVMLNTQRGGIHPLLDDDDELLTFDGIEEARAAGKSTVLGDKFGYEIFSQGEGWL